LSVKVAGRDGSADVSTVLAAIQWVVSFRQRYGIGVLNLSLGTDSTQSTQVDPLNYAVERAWQAGITIVVSASNRGPAPGTISKPGDDPWVVTVGAVDDMGTKTVTDDRLPLFSGRGPTAGDGWAKPDLVAPGAHVVSLRAPGSAIDSQFPASIDGAYHEGSGTSMAAAVVSGVAALVLGAHPSLGPDRVKHILTAVSRPAASTNPLDVGAGVVDAYAAVVAPPAGLANAGAPRSTGLGGLDLSRGGVRVNTDGVPSVIISGLLTAQDVTWDPIGFVVGDWSASTWYLSLWYLFPWSQVDWYGSNWENESWQGSER
jgi:serine protease AprX